MRRKPINLVYFEDGRNGGEYTVKLLGFWTDSKLRWTGITPITSNNHGEIMDEDMFEMTQDQESDEEDTYTLAASEIAVRKIRLEKEKEKAIAIVQDLKKLQEELKRAEEERERVKKEREEMQLQKVQKLANLKKLQETRVSLEAAVNDLTLKVKFEEAETKNMAERMQAKLKDAEETLESYKIIYSQFPLALKVTELESKKKNVLIELSLTKNKIQDVKAKEKLLDKITRQRQNAWAVNLAKLYKERQEKLSITDNLRKRKQKLSQLLEDQKSGKVTNLKKIETTLTMPKGFSQSIFPEQVTPTQERFVFKMPQFQINSPPPILPSSVKPITYHSEYNWDTLLGGISLGSKNISKSPSTRKDDSCPKELTGQVQKVSSQSASNEKVLGMQVDTTQSSKQINENLSNVKKTLQLSQKDYSELNSKVQSKPDASSGVKRNSSECSLETNNYLPTKKNDKLTNKENSQPLDNSNTVNNTKTKILLPQKENITKPTITAKPTPGTSLNGNLKYILSLKQKGVQQQKPQEFPKSGLVPQKLNLTANTDYNFKTNINNQQKRKLAHVENEPQLDEGVSMDPTSPPDIVPSENNSQPLSQPQQKRLSQLSGCDFDTSLELNEKEKELFNQMATESPGYVYNLISPVSQNSQKENIDVKSVYFSKDNPTSSQSQDGELNAPDVAVRADQFQSPRVSGGYQDLSLSSPMPNCLSSPIPNCLSPPDANLVSGGYQGLTLSPPMQNRFCPPNANLGFTHTNADSKESLLDSGNTKRGNKSPEGFSFNFGSSASEPSLFSMF